MKEHYASRNSRSTAYNTLTAPFLVPAVLEAIASSKYVHVTAVVPGEADAYCAEAVRKGGGTILSNDSDLFLYDLGPDGCVGSLDNLTFEYGWKNPVVKTNVVKPIDVARRLQLPDIHRLAYILNTQRPASLEEAVHLAKASGLDYEQLSTFTSEFTTSPYILECQNIHHKVLIRLHSISPRTPFLDPRISEFVLSSHLPSPSMYLSCLIEDPSRTTAWRVSSILRQFAYSCCVLPFGLGAHKKIQEYIRKCNKPLPTFVPSIVQLLPKRCMWSCASVLHERVLHFMNIFSTLPKWMMWRTYALAEVYHWYLDTVRTPPSRPAMITILTGATSDHDIRTWEDIYLEAQIQAYLYSLRMLQQILRFCLPMILPNKDDEGICTLVDMLMMLERHLESLPRLQDLMPSHDELRVRSKDVDVEQILDQLAAVLQADLCALVSNALVVE